MTIIRTVQYFQTGGTRLASSFFKPVTDYTVLNTLSAKARQHVS